MPRDVEFFIGELIKFIQMNVDEILGGIEIERVKGSASVEITGEVPYLPEFSKADLRRINELVSNMEEFAGMDLVVENVENVVHYGDPNECAVAFGLSFSTGGASAGEILIPKVLTGKCGYEDCGREHVVSVLVPPSPIKTKKVKTGPDKGRRYEEVTEYIECTCVDPRPGFTGHRLVQVSWQRFLDESE